MHTKRVPLRRPAPPFLTRQAGPGPAELLAKREALLELRAEYERAAQVGGPRGRLPVVHRL
jgi:hypothetical protein